MLHRRLTRRQRHGGTGRSSRRTVKRHLRWVKGSRKGCRDKSSRPPPPSVHIPHLYLADKQDRVIPKGGTNMATDPVCFMIVDEDTAHFRSTYRDTEYYFCCNYCKKQFDANPKRYSRLATDMRVDMGSGC